MTDDLAALLARIEAQHAHKAAAPKPPRRSWRSSLEARLAEKDDEPELAARPYPAELESVERGEFLKHYTTEEICAWINRACAETQQASERARVLCERMRRT